MLKKPLWKAFQFCGFYIHVVGLNWRSAPCSWGWGDLWKLLADYFLFSQCFFSNFFLVQPFSCNSIKFNSNLIFYSPFQAVKLDISIHGTNKVKKILALFVAISFFASRQVSLLKRFVGSGFLYRPLMLYTQCFFMEIERERKKGIE